MNEKKYKTLGEFVHHLIDNEEGKELRKGEGGKEKYQSWVFKQISEVFNDEKNPAITFEIALSQDVLWQIFKPLESMFDCFFNGCQDCYKRMETAYNAEIKKPKN